MMNYDHDGFPIADFRPAKDADGQIHRIFTWRGTAGVALCSAPVVELSESLWQVRGGDRCASCSKQNRSMMASRSDAMLSADVGYFPPMKGKHSARGVFLSSRRSQGARHTGGGYQLTIH